MAIWQYTFQVLTKDSFNSIGSPMVTEGSWFDEEPYWQHKSIERYLFSNLESILGKGKSWSDKIDVYGDLESNCFEVLFDDQCSTVLSASFRINFISDYEDILRRIIEFCLLNGLVILDENLHIVPLNVETVKSIIENATQVRKYNKLLNSKSPD